MMMVSRRTVLLGASALALPPATAWSQDQNVKIVYPFSVGNAGEAVAGWSQIAFKRTCVGRSLSKTSPVPRGASLHAS